MSKQKPHSLFFILQEHYRSGSINIDGILDYIKNEKSQIAFKEMCLWLTHNNVKEEDLAKVTNFFIRNLKEKSPDYECIIKTYIDSYTLKKISETNTHLQLFFIDYLLEINKDYYHQYKEDILNIDFGECSLFYFNHPDFLDDIFKTDPKKAAKNFVNSLVQMEELIINEVLLINKWIDKIKNENIFLKSSQISEESIKNMLKNCLLIYINYDESKDKKNNEAVNQLANNIILLCQRENISLSSVIDNNDTGSFLLNAHPIVFNVIVGYTNEKEPSFKEKLLNEINESEEIAVSVNGFSLLMKKIKQERKEIEESVFNDSLLVSGKQKRL